MTPKYPVYVISKGRWEHPLTARALERMGVGFRIVIEPQEFEQYRKVIDSKKILILPFSNLGQGSIPARNWVWDNAEQNGHDRHWILDDNISEFYRFNSNLRFKMRCGTAFTVIEEFSDRFTNAAISGMNYMMFVPKKTRCDPITLNTRIYSIILLNHNLPYRWRGRYNEDTDLSLRALKNKWCTILFNIFIANKQTTMTMKGGNTDELYAGNDARWKMAESLRQQHPDVVKITRKWDRWQHHVDYRPFKNNILQKRAGVSIANGVDNFGMKLLKK